MNNLNLLQKIIISTAGVLATVALFSSGYSLGELNATRAANRSSVPALIQPSNNKEIKLTEELFRDWAKLARQSAKTYTAIYLDSKDTQKQEAKKSLLSLLNSSNDMIAKIESSNFDRFDKNMIKGDYLQTTGYIEGFLGSAK